MSGVTVIVPAYNEGSAFAGSLAALADYLAIHRGSGYEFQYLIVDDGSTDETNAVAAAFARRRRNVRVLRHERNRGLGAALRTALAAVDTELAVVLDADMSYSPAVAIELLEALENARADIALASPYIHGGAVRNVPFARRVLSREANRLLSFATGGRYSTLTCVVRAYRVCAARELEFASDDKPAVAQMLLDGLRKNLQVIEVPATLQWSDERRSRRSTLATRRVASQIGTTALLAFRYRPTLWLAVPGLFPGLLPLVVALLLILHVKATTLALGTAATVVIQYASLALFTGQITTFLGRRFRQKRRFQSNGARTPNGYDASSRTA
jgi:glycosyltransferase involved in cell wall biosynthesis